MSSVLHSSSVLRSSPVLHSESYTFDPRPFHPLVSSVKRYYLTPSPGIRNGLTLIFAPGGGFPKELWEPVIEDLLDVVGKSQTGNSKIKIREIWSLDAPNSGDSALLNEDTLQWGYEPFRWDQYGRSIHAFLSGLGCTHVGLNLEGSVVPNFDFSSQTLVGVGHSLGAVSFLLSLDFSPFIARFFSSIIMIEPMLMNQEASHSTITTNFARSSSTRRDMWPSREEAYMAFKASRKSKIWDDRVLQKFVKHGLRPLPSLEYPDIRDGVTLKCTRKQETASFQDINGPGTIVYRWLPSYLSRVRLHLVYSERNDATTAETKHDIIYNASGGPANFATIGHIDGAGHLAPQTHPRRVAEHISTALLADLEVGVMKAKL